MSTYLRLAGIAAALAAVMCSPVASQEDPWGKLEHRTAWVPIGQVTPGAGSEFATMPNHRVLSAGEDNPRLMPRTGDVIEVTHLGLIRLYVADFSSKGEARRMESQGAIQRLLNSGDMVGERLPVGTRLLVHEIQLRPLPSGDNFVWLRVSPAK
jgi:hypothetical protein